MAEKEVESIRAFGRRIGRDHTTVIEAIEDGRIPPEAVKVNPATERRQGIYWRLALEAYSQNTDPTQAERSGAAPMDTSTASSNPGQAATPPGAGGVGSDLFQAGEQLPAQSKGKEDPHRYREHRARTEEFKALAAELDYQKDLGNLVPIADVREANFSRYRTLRDKLLNIPDRVATILAAEREPTRVHQQLTEEIKRVLSELSTEASAAAAEGAAERVAA